MAAIADREVLEPAVDKQINQGDDTQYAVGDEVETIPVEPGTDQGSDNHDGQTKLRVEILAKVEVAALAEWTRIDSFVCPHRISDHQRYRRAAPTTRRLVGWRRGVEA